MARSLTGARALLLKARLTKGAHHASLRRQGLTGAHASAVPKKVFMHCLESQVLPVPPRRRTLRSCTISDTNRMQNDPQPDFSESNV